MVLPSRSCSRGDAPMRSSARALSGVRERTRLERAGHHRGCWRCPQLLSCEQSHGLAFEVVSSRRHRSSVRARARNC
eukprot:11624877-Alexandrium_andersonii.AAC.1